MKKIASKKRSLPADVPQRIQPVIIHSVSPHVIFADPRDFMWIVQSLTGSSDTRLRCMQRKPCSTTSDRDHDQQLLESSDSTCIRSANNDYCQALLPSGSSDSELNSSSRDMVAVSTLNDEHMLELNRYSKRNDEGPRLDQPTLMERLNPPSPNGGASPLIVDHGFHHQQLAVNGHHGGELLESLSSDFGSPIDYDDSQIISRRDCEVNRGDRFSSCFSSLTSSSGQGSDLLFSKPSEYSFLEMHSTKHMDKTQLFPGSTADSYLEFLLSSYDKDVLQCNSSYVDVFDLLLKDF